MYVVACPGSRNQEFGQLLGCLTEKYCEMVKKMDELIIELKNLKEKNDKVIKFQEDNFSHQGDSISVLLERHNKLRIQHEEDNQERKQSISETRSILELQIRELREEQNIKMEKLINTSQQTRENNTKLLEEVDLKITENKMKIAEVEEGLKETKECYEPRFTKLEESMAEVEQEQEKTNAISGSMEQLIQEKKQSEDNILTVIRENVNELSSRIESKSDTSRLDVIYTSLSNEADTVRLKMADFEVKSAETFIKISETEQSVQTSLNQIKDDIASMEKNIMESKTSCLKFRDEYLSTFGESESKQQIEEKDRRRDAEYAKSKFDDLKKETELINQRLQDLDNKFGDQHLELQTLFKEKHSSLEKSLQTTAVEFRSKHEETAQSLRKELKLVKENLNTKLEDTIQLAVEDSRSQIKIFQEKISSLQRDS
ncbi:titin homolog isoform X2 [Eurytemora carolleeae]|uniref:titin homolog isoform X2 n=1 Tax=Eurytemora carolleeae TaxID=1294199 RepID=UPI000C769914|nr:titin homolog isoform X2 [Eurytemora carolleeae]|eukprot:XP_023323453.1 titin homolog isoform X2 [Eurytemora affinis]